MSDGWNIALLGATGTVGNALLELLQERSFPTGEFYPLASGESAGESVRFNGKTCLVQDAATFDWSQVQLAFFVAGQAAAARYAEEAATQGCVVLDSSGLFALDADVPLVVPGVNSQALVEYRNRNLVAVANNMVCQLLTAITPLIEQSGLSRLYLTNLLPASAHGKAAVDALAGESVRLLNGLPLDEVYFHRQLAFNLLPLLPDEQGSVVQERELVEQVRKVLQDPGLPLAVSCLQAPVFYGNAQIVQLEGLRPLSADEACTLWQNAEPIQLSEAGEYPTPVGDASDNITLSIGCVRNDYGMPELLQFWSVADNVRFGAALMAIETAESLIEMQEQFY